MQPQTRRSLDGLLAIGPHSLDDQLVALTAYAAHIEHTLDVFWILLPDEDPVTGAPDSGFPIVAFDDEIAGFTEEEYHFSTAPEEAQGAAVTDWHVAHATPRPKVPTTHLPVYGYMHDGETAADAILYIGGEPLDLQLARIEAYAIRSALRIGGVYVASDSIGLQVLLRDFGASNRALGTGLTLTVGQHGQVQVHD